MSRAEDNRSEERSTDNLSEATLGGSAGDHTPQDAVDPLVRGSTVGRYTVLDCIGSGGMGVVYSAFDPHLDRRVALKVMHCGNEGTASSVGKSRLLREAQAMAKLSHPNVITVHDVGTFGDRVFVAMEFIEGTTLRHWQRHEHHEWPEIVHAYVRAGRGLAAAHAAGLVHRDFKPDNVLMGFDGRVLVMDFGLARQAARGPGSLELPVPSSSEAMDELLLTRTGAVLGTPAYMAPEQHRGSDTVGPFSDQFSFCIALYEGLYGERPFAGNSMTSLAMNVLEGAVRAPPRDSRIPAWLRRVVLRGLATDPLDRFPSMDALLAELQRDPPNERRPWVAMGIALGLASIAGMTYVFSRSPSDIHCKDAQSPIESTWTDAIKAATREALAESQAPYVEPSWDSTSDRLDQYATRWTRAFQERCEFVMSEPSRLRTPDPGLRCLEQGQVDFHSLTEALRSNSSGVVRHAASAAEALPDPSRCSLLPRSPLDAPVATPRAAASTEGFLQRALAQARALARTGQSSAAEVHLPPLLATTQAQHLPELHAEALLLQSTLPPSSSRPVIAAERTLRKALLAAAEAKDPHLEARVWTRWMALVGLEERHPREGRRLALGLESTLARADDAPPDLRATFWLGQGALDQFQGRYEMALQRARRAFDELGQSDWPGPLHEAAVQHAVGLALEGLARFPEAVEAHSAALVLREQTLGAQHPAIAESLLRLASALLGAHRSDAAEASLVRARMLLDPERTISSSSPPIGRDDALVLAHIVDALGLVARHREAYEEAMVLHREALKLLETFSPDDVAHQGYPLENLGLAYADQKQHDLALPLLERALSSWRKGLDPEHPDRAIAHVNLANTLWALGHFESALEHYTKAREIWENTLPHNHALFGYALTGIGRAQLELGQPLLALDVLERALELRDNEFEDALNLAETELLLGRALWGSARDPERALERVLSAREIVGSYEPFEPSAVRRVLEGASVERFTDQLDPAGLSVTCRLSINLGEFW